MVRSAPPRPRLRPFPNWRPRVLYSRAPRQPALPARSLSRSAGASSVAPALSRSSTPLQVHQYVFALHRVGFESTEVVVARKAVHCSARSSDHNSLRKKTGTISIEFDGLPEISTLGHSPRSRRTMDTVWKDSKS